MVPPQAGPLYLVSWALVGLFFFRLYGRPGYHCPCGARSKDGHAKNCPMRRRK